MSLPPIYESFRKSGIRFVTNSPDGKFKTNCPECGRPNTLFVELDADGLGFRCHCEGEGCGFSGFERLRPPPASGNGPSPRDDADEKRRLEEARREFDAFEEARRELPEDDEPAPAPEPDPDPECEPEPEPASEAPTIDAAEGAPDGSHTHVWRAKEGDFPCTPTGQEHRDEKDGRVYAQVINSDGGLSIVPKDELFPKERDEAPQHKPPTIAEATALRRELVAAGYLPIPLFGKKPPLENWSDLTSVNDAMIVMWAKTWPDAVNTGVLTRNVPTLDLDILNEEAVRACEDLVREHCEEAGYILVRIGLPPKRAIPFRTDEPFDKITFNLIAPNATADAKPEKIEFLCNGQQVVVAGIHPDTKRPYRWHGGEPGKIKREELPYTREAEARPLVDKLLSRLTEDFGYATRPRPSKSKRTGDGSDRGGGGGAADWQYLVENIIAGRELHDSLLSLAAKMITAGTGVGATINHLRALMDSSSAPRGERWQQRYDDIPRLVEGAEERFGAGTPKPKDPPPKPKESTQPKTQQGEPQTSAIDETVAKFREWLLLKDATPLLALLGTVAANYLPGDPVWFGIVAPGSSAKTEMLNSVYGLPNIHKSGPMTLPALLSGTPKRQRDKTARGGLLREVGDFGIIVAKDFGSILSMRPDAKAEVLGALREVYDGEYTRRVGTEGGRQLYWQGKVGFVFGTTPVIDSHHSVIGAMGERFLLSRLTPEADQFIRALKHSGNKTAIMRKELAESVSKLFANLLADPSLYEPPPLSDDEIQEINKVVSLVVALRGPIERDRYSREIENIYGKEGTGRLGLTLERLLAGLDAIGVERRTAMEVIKTVAMDSLPPIRRAAYECVYKYHSVTTADVAIEIGLPTNTVRRALEDLAAYGLVERNKPKKNLDTWKAVNPQGKPAQRPAKASTPEYATEDDERTQMGEPPNYWPDD